MQLSELKIIIDSGIKYFDEDLEVEVFDSKGSKIEPFQMAKISATGKVIFD